jgi:hypothetical protein
VRWQTAETKEFDIWFDSLEEIDQVQIIAAIRYLREHGPSARMPVSAPIRQPNSCGMKELRPGSSGRSEIRILYAFDTSRKAILLLGGDKAARRDDWAAWYDRNVPIADRLFSHYCRQPDVISGPQVTTKSSQENRRKRKRR